MGGGEITKYKWGSKPRTKKERGIKEKKNFTLNRRRR